MKQGWIILIYVGISLFIFGAIVLMFDLNYNNCEKEGLGIKLQKAKLCSVTTGGSFTYTTDSWFFEEKECEVEFSC